MIKAVMTNTVIKVEEFSNEIERLALKQLLTFTVPNYYYMTAYKRRFWDGTYSFWNDYSKTFPTGLWSILPDNLKAKFDMKDGRKQVPHEIRTPIVLDGFELRDYQLEAVEQAIQKTRSIITAPTNAGKTICGAGFLKAVPERALWLTHRANLMYQTKEKFEQALNEKIGVVHRDTVDIQRVTIGMVQTIFNRMSSENARIKAFFRNWLQNEIDILIIDECHHSSATTFYKIARFCNAYWRIGFSATPLMREEIQNLRLIGVTGEEIKTVTNKALIERGISAAPQVYRVKNFSLRYSNPRNWMAAYAAGIETNKERNDAIASIVRLHKRRNEPVLILVNTFRHSDELLSRLGEDAILVCGETEAEERNQLLRALERREVPALVATPLFDEGVDAPEIRVLVLASAGKSHLRLLQRLGRGMRRKSTGENTIRVYDFEDRGNKYLEGHSIHRLQLYQKEGFEVIPIEINSPTLYDGGHE